MADMFAPLVAQLKADPKTIVFTEGNDPRILEAASKLLAEGAEGRYGGQRGRVQGCCRRR